MARVRFDGSCWSRDGDYQLLLLLTCADTARGFYIETDESENVTNVHDSKEQGAGFKSLVNRYDRATAWLRARNWEKDGEIDEAFNFVTESESGLERLMSLFADESAEQLKTIWKAVTGNDVERAPLAQEVYQIQTKNTLSGSW